MTRLAPRVKHHENGTTTVSGVPYRDLRSILTAACLYRYEHEDRIAETGCPDNMAWDRRIKNIINMLEPLKYRSGYENVPLSQLEPHQIAVRRRNVIARRRDRLEFQDLWKSLTEGAIE